ncbi:MAG: glycosyltransferase, partial [Variibacter sp.]|nr:glycosyltransferase [Variibacter sp.]
GLNEELPPVTAIMPMHGLEPELSENLDRLFGQDYPRFEVMLAFTRADSPAIALARQAMQRWPGVTSTLLIGESTQFVDPKVRNEFKALEAAKTDFVYIVDSNVSLPPDALRLSMRQMQEGVALVTAVAVAARPGNPAGHLETAFLNGFGARHLLAGSALGLDIVLGKSLLVRWSEPLRRAVPEQFSRIGSEDTGFLYAAHTLAMRARVSEATVAHPVGARRWHAFWHRHARWTIYRRLYYPVSFGLEIASGFWPAVLCGAVGGPTLGLSATAAVALTVAAWFGGEWLLHLIKRWPVGWPSPLAWVARELLLPVLWARALTRREVTWNSTRISIPRR